MIYRFNADGDCDALCDEGIPADCAELCEGDTVPEFWEVVIAGISTIEGECEEYGDKQCEALNGTWILGPVSTGGTCTWDNGGDGCEENYPRIILTLAKTDDGTGTIVPALSLSMPEGCLCPSGHSFQKLIGENEVFDCFASHVLDDQDNVAPGSKKCNVPATLTIEPA